MEKAVTRVNRNAVGEDKVDKLFEYLEGGSTVVEACKLAGISREWYYLKRSADPEFLERCDLSEAKCKQRCIDIVHKAAVKTWQAAAWWLERKHPEEFALKHRMEHSGIGGKAIEVRRVNDKLDKLLDGLTSRELVLLVEQTLKLPQVVREAEVVPAEVVSGSASGPDQEVTNNGE